MEETSWRQKSRKLLLKEGDKNTNFFHKMTTAHKRRNALVKIKLNGTWVLEESEIKDGVGRAFQSLWTKTRE